MIGGKYISGFWELFKGIGYSLGVLVRVTKEAAQTKAGILFLAAMPGILGTVAMWFAFATYGTDYIGAALEHFAPEAIANTLEPIISGLMPLIPFNAVLADASMVLNVSVTMALYRFLKSWIPTLAG